MSAGERVETLTRLLQAADNCRLMLTEQERDVIAEAIELYQEQDESESCADTA
jgi:hypothetical protein